MINRPKSKIVATVGPASSAINVIENLIEKGVSIFRINFSHSSHELARSMIKIIREASWKLNIPVAVIGDLQGPKIRIGTLHQERISLRLNETISIINKDTSNVSQEIPLPDKEVYDAINPGQNIVLGDGEIELKCTRILSNRIEAKVINEGTISSQKGFHLPGKVIKISKHIKKDMEDFQCCIDNQVDFVMLSFVQTKDDIIKYKDILSQKNINSICIGSKIETRSSIDNLDEIITHSDFVVVARGDLAIETSYFDIPILQKSIIEKSNKYGIPVIVATQMLESMIKNQEPTRAEISDIANAILDGTDGLMLSGETAIGRYPEKAVEILVKTADKLEEWKSKNIEIPIKNLISDDLIADAISKSTMIAGNDLNAKCLICTTRTGKTARLLSRYRPNSPILAFTFNKDIINRLLLFRGIYPFEIDFNDDFEELIKNSIDKAINIYSLKKGDIILYSAGLSRNNYKEPQTNFLHIRKI